MPTSPTRVAASPTAGRPDDGAGQHYLVGDQPTGAGEGKASSWLHVDMSPWSRRAAPFVAKLRVRGLKHVLVEMPWPMLLLCLLLYYVVGGSSAMYFKKYFGAYRRRTSSAAPTQRGVSSRPLNDAVLGWTPHTSVFAAGMLERKKTGLCAVVGVVLALVSDSESDDDLANDNLAGIAVWLYRGAFLLVPASPMRHSQTAMSMRCRCDGNATSMRCRCNRFALHTPASTRRLRSSAPSVRWSWGRRRPCASSSSSTTSWRHGTQRSSLLTTS